MKVAYLKSYFLFLYFLEAMVNLTNMILEAESCVISQVKWYLLCVIRLGLLSEAKDFHQNVGSRAAEEAYRVFSLHIDINTHQ